MTLVTKVPNAWLIMMAWPLPRASITVATSEARSAMVTFVTGPMEPSVPWGWGRRMRKLEVVREEAKRL